MTVIATVIATLTILSEQDTACRRPPPYSPPARFARFLGQSLRTNLAPSLIITKGPVKFVLNSMANSSVEASEASGGWTATALHMSVAVEGGALWATGAPRGRGTRARYYE